MRREKPAVDVTIRAATEADLTAIREIYNHYVATSTCTFQLEPDTETFRVPDCPACGGVLKPAVVFFGEGVPRYRVDQAMDALAAADALLVVGSSLMVFSGYRFCLAARDMGKPIAAVTMADAAYQVTFDPS